MRAITRRLKRFGEVEDSVDLLIKNLSHLSLLNMEVPDIKNIEDFPNYSLLLQSIDDQDDINIESLRNQVKKQGRG